VTAAGVSPKETTSPLMLVPVALALLAEAAWTAVLAGVVQAFVLHDPTLGIPGTLVACLAGAVAMRRLAPRAGERWPAVAAWLTIGIGALGWLSSPEVRSILASEGVEGIQDALVAGLGGWVAGIAFLRGMPYATLPPDPHPIETALAIGTPGIALAAVIGGMVGEPFRGRFLGDASLEVVVFLVAGFASLTLSRLTLVGSGSGGGSVDWRRNPAWLALTGLLLLGIAGIAVAASLVAGPVIVTVLGVAIPSLLVLGFVAGFNRRSARIVVISGAVALVVAQVLRMLNAAPRDTEPPPAIPALPPAEPPPPVPVTFGLLGIAIVLAVIAIIILIRLWMSRPRVPDDAADEDRWIDHGDQSGRDVVRRRRRGLRFGRPRPADAVAAYRLLLEELAPNAGVRREEGETPAEHAGRLRDAGSGGLALDLLAADYGLVRFGGVRLSDAEERRAIGRSSSLSRRLLAQARTSTAAGSGPGAADRPGEQAAPEGGPGARSRFRVG
jgi:hypothetical protein